MSRYVDTVLIPVPTDSLDTYREMATDAGEIWMNHGALDYFEGVEDGHAAEETDGPMRTVPDLVDATEEETIVFAVMVFESEAHRDEVRAAVMDDPVYREQFGGEMPFDPKRMTTGSFTSIVSVES